MSRKPRKITSQQIEALKKFHIYDAQSWNYDDAQERLLQCKIRLETGLAFWYQVGKMVECGIDRDVASAMTARGANAVLANLTVPVSERQKSFLKKHGLADEEIGTMTRQQAFERVAVIKGDTLSPLIKKRSKAAPVRRAPEPTPAPVPNSSGWAGKMQRGFGGCNWKPEAGESA